MSETTYDNTNRGATWENRDKKEPKHPDYKGSINVDGKDYWLSTWVSDPETRGKKPVFSHSVQLKEAKKASSGESPF